MYTKEYLNGKTAKELAQIQNGKSYGGVSSKHNGSKPMSTIRTKLEAIKKEKAHWAGHTHALLQDGFLLI